MPPSLSSCARFPRSLSLFPARRAQVSKPTTLALALSPRPCSCQTQPESSSARDSLEMKRMPPLPLLLLLLPRAYPPRACVHPPACVFLSCRRGEREREFRTLCAPSASSAISPSLSLFPFPFFRCADGGGWSAHPLSPSSTSLGFNRSRMQLFSFFGSFARSLFFSCCVARTPCEPWSPRFTLSA